MLHYDPQHVSSSTLLILRRTNCITTASGIVTLQTAVQYAGGERTAVRSPHAYHFLKNSVSLDVTPCRLVEICQSFVGNLVREY